ncbi:MAG: AzlC family ABC transporter permease [Clostridia bacterium]|nr:AzlC family ABC transporter permease [Clostridia bacterium]
MGKKTKALKAAFPKTIPILAGYGFLGTAYGIYMATSGFGVLYVITMCIVIFGGAMQFVGVPILLAPFAPIQTLIITLLVQARHIFYGIAMLDKLKDIGLKKLYIIYGVVDETFSINYTAQIPDDVDKGWFMFFVTLLDHIYWILGSVFGAVAGSLIKFSTEGIDFVMTAMFVVIFMEQWKKEKQHYSAIIGLISAIGCLLIFGADSFMVPTMICILVLLAVFKKPIEKEGGYLDD